MRLKDINLRDPFVFAEKDKYYMYGTRMDERKAVLGLGFDVYVSSDLEEWEVAPAFTPDKDFWSDTDFWAPEVHKYNGRYYMLASFYTDNKSINRGTQVLVSDSPKGPFLPHSDGAITPKEWMCLDGTLYVDKNGTPYLVFCHEWVQIDDGEMCVMQLSEDLKKPVGEPKVLFKASDPVWSDGIFDKKYVTDGPFMYRTKNGRLMMTWSTFHNNSYCVGLAYSDNGEIDGVWQHDERLLFDNDGGHGMIFESNGKKYFSYHKPNNSPLERPCFTEIEETDDTLYVK